jgi:hypothetical protein
MWQITVGLFNIRNSRLMAFPDMLWTFFWWMRMSINVTISIAQQALYMLCSGSQLHRRYSLYFLAIHTIHFSTFLFLFVRYRVLILPIFSVLLYESFLGHFTKIPEWDIGEIILAGDTRDKPVPLSLSLPLTQHTLIWDRTRTFAITDLRPTTFLKQKCLFIAQFQITKYYTFGGLNVISYSQ